MKKTPVLFLTLSCLLLGACTQVTSFFYGDKTRQINARHNAKPHTSYDAAAYVTNLALARLALVANPDNDIADSAEAINGYAAKKQHKQSKLNVIIISYQAKDDGSMQEIVAPIASGSLQTVMDKFANTGTIQSLRVATVTLQPDKSQALPKDSRQLIPTLYQQQQTLLINVRNLDLTDDIKTQLNLIAFFTSGHYQDAAYLSVDNVKRLLADATLKKKLNENALQSFSKELESKESTLKEVLPYTL